ncbi:MAG TPA: DPP IV N-terminal domain-containing protein [Thermoanaerobaculia bacterium]|nr:DPP IV N-terminal domain-containing protein [Thermoanaerobaculia bacterium]
MNQVPAGAADPIPLEVVFAEEGHARAPSELVWTEDGKRLSFLWSKEGQRDLWTVAPEDDREPQVLLRAGELRDGDRDIGYKDYAWSPDGTAILFQGAGDLYLYRLADQKLRPLTRSDAKSEDPRFSPDSTKVAFVRAADLWTVDLVSGEERRLTHDGEEGRVLNGKPDWVYWEEIWHRRSIGFWWAPEGRRIAYLRFDQEGVPRHPLVHDADRDPTVEQQPYPKAGDRNPTVSLGVLDLASGETAWIETGARAGEDYIARVRFTPDGKRLAVVRLDRDQAEAALLFCDLASGACETRLVERLSTWVDVGDDFELLADGRVVWGSDRDGWRRLYLHDAGGWALHAVTPEGIAVTKLDRVIEVSGKVLFTGFRTDRLGARDRQLYRVQLEGGEAELLSPGCEGAADDRGRGNRSTAGRGERGGPGCEPVRGTIAAVVAPGGRAWVATHSTAATPPRSTLFVRDEAPVPLPFQPATAYDRASLPHWEFLTIPGPDGAPLPARVMRPPDFDATRRHPVIMFHYGGPASQTVEDASAERPVRDLWHARQAQRGYVVVNADNPASVFFGKQGADRLHRRFGELEMQSQLAVVEHLAAQPWVDRERLGLWGWSGGGTNTLYSVLRRPGVWRAAVAGAPVTDWRLYDSIWTERYLDHPETNEAGYRDSSPVTWAPALADALLVVHGTADDNVHPQNTYALVRELVKAGRPFEQAIYPGEKHAFGDTANRHFYQRMEEFFDRWLLER